MKRSLGTELCCLLGPDGGTGIFGGMKAAPFCGRVGSIAFPRVAMMPFLKKHKKKKSASPIIFRTFWDGPARACRLGSFIRALGTCGPMRIIGVRHLTTQCMDVTSPLA